MNSIIRTDFSKGWVPNADSTNCAPGALLRMDNLVLDELGSLSLRKGSVKTYTVSGAVYNIFSCPMSGTKKVIINAGDSIYEGTNLLASGINSTGDVSINSYMGNVFWARGTTKSKWAGTNVYAWGASAPNAFAASGVQAGGPNRLEFTNFEDADWTSIDGTESHPETDEMLLTATQVTGAGTYRASSEGTTHDALADYSTYGGGITSSDDDLITFWMRVADPTITDRISFYIDCDDGSFSWNYYQYVIQNGDEISIEVDDTSQWMEGEYGVEGADRDYIKSVREIPKKTVTTFRHDAIADNSWVMYRIRRGEWKRTGSTFGKDWSTIAKLKIVVEGQTSAAAVQFAHWDLIGGSDCPLTGKYRYRYTYVNTNNSNYVVESGPSPASDEVRFEGQRGLVHCLISAEDQVDKVYIYRMGGNLPSYYLVASGTNAETGGHTAQIEVTDSMSDRDALINGITLVTDAQPPPDNIIDIETDYYERLFCLDATTLYPSKVRNPETFSLAQQIVIGGATETCYWVKKAFGGLYVGTSKDIYRIDGTFEEYPDGTFDAKKVQCNIGTPPISKAVCVEGNTIVYLSSDGWRFFNGASAELITGDIDLLFRGYDRHDVKALNMSTGRFRAAINKSHLSFLAPEGTSTTSTSALWRYDIPLKRWYRFTYPMSLITSTYALQCIHRTYDGDLLAGDAAGRVYTLDSGTDDDGNSIAIEVRSHFDDGNVPFTRKDALDFSAHLDGIVACSFYTDGVAIQQLGVTISNSTYAKYQTSLATLTSPFTTMQVKLVSAGVTAFLLRNWCITYNPRGMLLYYLSTKPQSPSARRRRFAGMSLVVDTGGNDVTVTVYKDGAAITDTTTVNTTSPVTTIIDWNPSTSIIGKDLWLTISGPSGFEYYDSSPLVVEEFPIPLWGRFPSTNAGYPYRKVTQGIRFKACTVGEARLFTLLLDGATVSTLTKKTGRDEADEFTLQVPVSTDRTGRVARDISFKTDGPVEVWSWEPIIIDKLPMPFNGLTPETNCGYEGEKVLSGVKMKVCTLGVERTFTFFYDDTEYAYTKAVTTGSDEPDTVMWTFPGTLTGTDFALYVDGDIELYSWEPDVAYTKPKGRLCYDTGPVNIGDDIEWVREIRVKVEAGGDFTVTPYFDGTPFTAYNVTATPGREVLYHVPVGRTYKGHIPRAVITSSSPFKPYYLEFVIRPSGHQREMKAVRVNVK